MVTPIVTPVFVNSGGGSFESVQDAFIILGIIVLLCSFILYWVGFFVFGWKDEAVNKKQFALQFFIPFYWWVVWIKEGIKSAIKRYKDF